MENNKTVKRLGIVSVIMAVINVLIAVIMALSERKIVNWALNRVEAGPIDMKILLIFILKYIIEVIFSLIIIVILIRFSQISAKKVMWICIFGKIVSAVLSYFGTFFSVKIISTIYGSNQLVAVNIFRNYLSIGTEIFSIVGTLFMFVAIGVSIGAQNVENEKMRQVYYNQSLGNSNSNMNFENGYNNFTHNPIEYGNGERGRDSFTNQ